MKFKKNNQLSLNSWEHLCFKQNWIEVNFLIMEAVFDGL